MPTTKKTGRYTVRTAYPGDVFQASPDLRVDDQGVWAADKLQDLTESSAVELVEHARAHNVTVVMQSLDSDQTGPNEGQEA